MKKLLKSMSLFLVVAMLGVGLTGCGANKTSSKIKVGIIQNVAVEAMSDIRDGFKQAMADSGLDVEFDEQNAAGDTNLANTIAQNMVSNNVDMIFAIGTFTTQAAMTAVAGKGIPIVFGGVTDPSGAKIVENAENSTKENVTGVSDMADFETIVGFIKNFMPDAKKVGSIYSSKEDNAILASNSLKLELEKRGYIYAPTVFVENNELPIAIDNALKNCDVLVSFGTNATAPAADLIASKAMDAKKIVLGDLKEQVENGYLASAQLSYFEIGKSSGAKAIEIIKGKKAADIKIENGSNGEVYINKTTAQKLGIDISKFKDVMFVE